MAQDMPFSGESKNVEYKVTVPDKSEKYMKTVVAFANGRGDINAVTFFFSAVFSILDTSPQLLYYYNRRFI